MTPLAAAFLSILCAIVLFAPRRYALLAIFAGILFLSYRGGVNLGGLRMHAGRFLELAGFVRVMYRGEFTKAQFGPLDRAFVVTYSFVTLMFLLRTIFGPASAIAMVTPLSKTGDFVDVVLVYFTFRGLVKNLNDVRWLFERGVVLLIPLAISLAVEKATYRNPLVVLGSMPAVWIDDVDGGRIRCYGASSHPALLGTLGAWLAIVYVGLALSRESRKTGMLGLGLSVAIVLFANSGGPLTSLMAGMLGWGCWLLRNQMRFVRISIVAAFVLLALVMKDPIWYLPSKMSILFGGSGWHRSYLMNQAITHVGQWWLAGMPLDLTVPWFPYLVLGAADITNLYVAFGVDGGVGALALLVWLLVVAFRQVGQGMSQLRGSEQDNRDDQFLVWALGCGVLSHTVNYFSITYFDQTNALWLFQLAALAAVIGGLRIAKEREEPVGKERALARNSALVPRAGRRDRLSVSSSR
jgi:hypothetical protein